MQFEQTRLLLNEVREATHHSLHCYADLQELLVKLARVTEELVVENQRLAARLRRQAPAHGKALR